MLVQVFGVNQSITRDSALGADLFGSGNINSTFEQFPWEHQCNRYCEWFEIEPLVPTSGSSGPLIQPRSRQTILAAQGLELLPTGNFMATFSAPGASAPEDMEGKDGGDGSGDVIISN